MDDAHKTQCDRLLSLTEAMPGRRVAVLGDFMLDQYLYGDAERISPEAPVPVLRIVRRESTVGGAASVAADIQALDGKATCIGVVGDDPAGAELRTRLEAMNASTAGLITVTSRPTTLKTRLVGLAQHRHRQQLVRMDEEDASPIDAGNEQRLIAAVETALADCDVLCIQDYGKGVCTESLCQRAIAHAKRVGKRVLVDPMRSRDAARYRGAWLSTPNRTETELLTGMRLANIGAVESARAAIHQSCETEFVCVTLDAEGCALVGNDTFEHLATKARDVYDVTGAGDQVLATLAMAVAAGAELHEAATLANLAGGLEVEKFGCVPIQRGELIGEILIEHGRQLGKIRSIDQLLPEIDRRRTRGERILFTNGCFDLLHRGHVEYLDFCRANADVVIVAINTDASVKRQNKGADRPICNQDERALMLAALASVDFVVLFDDETPEPLLRQLKPHILVKGGDYADSGVVGREIVEANGGVVMRGPLAKGYSTTALIERIRKLN